MDIGSEKVMNQEWLKRENQVGKKLKMLPGPLPCLLLQHKISWHHPS